MARYTDDSKEKVRDAVDFADLVGRYTELRRQGGSQLMALCPFHEERSPSFSVDPVNKVFHCFGCNVSGDVYRFVELREGLDFKGSMEWLADRYGVALEVADEDPRDAARRAARARLLELLERTATFYARYLWESAEAEPAREYLRSRGLEEGTLREFRVGYAPSRWDTVLLASRRAGFSNREVADAGLATGGGDKRLYDRFRRRIMFPLTDRRGAVLGFGARALGPDAKPKYLNSSDGPVYHKGQHLFAADIARAPATRAQTVVLCEGYTDVLWMHQAGLKNTVGLMGTALTEDQVGELARLAPTVLLALDADAAGQEAMLRAAKVAAGKKVELRVVPLPDGKDPADLALEQGPGALKALVESSVPFVRFQVERVLGKADLATAEGKDAAIDELKPVFADVPPSAVREELLRTVADRTNLPPTMVSSWLSQGARRSRPAPAPAPRRPAAPPAPPPPATAQDAGDAGPPPDEDDDGRWGGYGTTAPTPARAAGSSAPAPPPRAPGGVASVSPAVRTERAWLAQCLALGELARGDLASVDAERLLSLPLHRRAVAHLLDHLADPTAGVPDEDRELAALTAELLLRAQRTGPSKIALQIETIKLELAAVERAITTVRTTGTGSIAELARRRGELKVELDAAMVAYGEEQEAQREAG